MLKLRIPVTLNTPRSIFIFISKQNKIRQIFNNNHKKMVEALRSTKPDLPVTYKYDE